jgi:hypothetical protein
VCFLNANIIAYKEKNIIVIIWGLITMGIDIEYSLSLYVGKKNNGAT